MTRAKSERLMNLLIMLLSTRRYVTRDEIRSAIDGYNGTSEGAFERQFERDKDELRGLGIQIQTGSNDPLFGDEEGYRIERADFELPPISFTPEERAVLSVAGRVWQDQVAADSTARAFEALRAVGAEPDLSQMPMLQPRIDGDDPGFAELLAAVTARQLVRFDYAGRRRTVQPWRLYQRRGRWYLLAFDADASAVRHFKLSRLQSEAGPIGRPGAFEVPHDADLLTSHSWGEETAVVALADDAPPELLASGEPIDGESGLPEGFVAYRMTRPSLEALAQDVCAAGATAIALDPPEFRQHVIDRLTAIAKGAGA
ncbi:helix-turn-helix transcriptional regulator [Tessaracoccus caeni]|uniref:helix-turn-helix transcriptional regulator n=1 Tax=Tessaracoccus caeni TaxID=3031239 RepID=UPI0023DC6C25|nr:WYL domain-containing protein [Tessaracoccus caeni]MDF1488012.1 WYL domain-containing protein [Tessaracoccus caeni]